jgi:hypothetical protein
MLPAILGTPAVTTPAGKWQTSRYSSRWYPGDAGRSLLDLLAELEVVDIEVT